jgi:hypothetical protein
LSRLLSAVVLTTCPFFLSLNPLILAYCLLIILWFHFIKHWLW